MTFNIEEYLDSLPLDTTYININDRKLTYIPDLSKFANLTILDCSFNLLTMLPPLNNSLRVLNCSHNNLTSFPKLNENLRELYCSFNNLTSLPILNDNLKVILCYNNKINIITNIPNTLTCLNYSNNDICDVIGINPFINSLKQKINTLNNFRVLYYALKFKKQFKRWLWERVREPKIIKQFHPDHLNKLKETDDLDEFLEEWIK
jgi:Leucine-rich repeat (LRR) protein